jgi:hypothetical protein
MPLGAPGRREELISRISTHGPWHDRWGIQGSRGRTEHMTLGWTKRSGDEAKTVERSLGIAKRIESKTASEEFPRLDGGDLR